MWVLSVLACSDGTAAPLSRPAPTGAGEVAAALVLHVAGAVEVTPALGSPFPAAPKQDLVDTDLLTPAEGAFVIVALTNGHLVRIDDVGALKVGQILLKKAPLATRDTASQLQALLDPGEQVMSAAVVERAAAWRHMQRAAETGGRGKAREREVRSDEAVSRGPAIGPTAGAPPPSTQAPPAETQKNEKKRSPPPEPQRPKKVGGGSEVSTQPQLDDLLDGPGAPPAQAAVPPPPPTSEPGVRAAHGAKPATTTPLPVAPFLGGGIAACLEQTAALHDLTATEVVLLVEVKGGFVTRVRFAGALPATACAIDLVGRPVAQADGWLRLSR